MNEVYVNSPEADRTVYLSIPVTPIQGSLNVYLKTNYGRLLHTFQTVTYDGEYYSVVVPYAYTASERDMIIEYDFHYMEDGGEHVASGSVQFSVVRPIVSVDEIKSLHPGLSDAEAVSLESSVRHIINAHCGQSFGYSIGKTLTVEGHGENALRLPERLVSITGVSTLTSALDPSAFIIVSDGWYLKKAWARATPLETPTDSQYWGDITDGVFNNNIYDDSDDGFNPGYNGAGQLVDPTLTPVSARSGGVTVAPGASGRSTPWKNDYPFKITGDWGYKTVPANVKEAARLLVNDYACSEIAYRDRYLESIRAADWRLQFSSSAWEYTGNARADQLLSEYVILDWAVI